MRFALGLAVVSSLAACDPPTNTFSLVGAQQNRSLEHDFLIPAPNPLGVKHQGLTAGDGPKGEQVLFINYGGATITKTANNGDPANDDATVNKSWIPNVGGGSTINVPAFDATPFSAPLTATEVKANITQLVTDWYAPYNVLVVTTRPVSGRYTMIMVGGQTTQVVTGQQDAVGVAGLDCGNDNQNNIGYAFSASELPQDTSAAAKQQAMLLVAQTIAHEAGHTFGLEHVNIANANIVDIMSVAVDPNVQGFLSGAQNLAELPCTCKPGDTTENTTARLTADPGSAPSGPVAAKPVITWLAPKQGQQVPHMFTASLDVQASASSGGTVTKVDIVQAGVTDAEMVNTPYQAKFTAPTSLPDGSPIRFTAVAYNSLGGKASVSVDFTVFGNGAQGPLPCVTNANCVTPDEICGSTSKTCIPAPPCSPACGANETCDPDTSTCVSTLDMAGQPTILPTEVGKMCTDSSECGTDGVCANAKGTTYCTKACDPVAADSCPLNYECVAVGADHFCGPKSSGCDVTRGSGSSPLTAVWGLFALAALIARRRLRPSAT